MTTILELINKMTKIEIRNEVNLDRIIKVNNWANSYLHRGIRPYPWQLDWAITEVQKLFISGTASNNTLNSIYSSFETQDIEEARDEFLQLLTESLTPTPVIHWNAPEIVDWKAWNNRFNHDNS